MRYLVAMSLFASGLAYGASCTNLPAGAEKLGYTTQLFYDQPTLAEVSATDTDSGSKWYPGNNGQPVSSNLTNRSHMSTVNGTLALSLHSGVSGETHTSTKGVLPFLSASNGFYIEFGMHLSSNDGDHFAGMYLMPVEHDLAKHDHLSGDPAGYERWTELDVSETGYGPGSLNSVIAWWGSYPLYSKTVKNSWGHDAAIDFTQEHRYGMSYNPATNILQWYIDDVPTWSTTAPNSTIKNWHYYPVLDASSHGAEKPYQMFIHYVAAYTK